MTSPILVSTHCGSRRFSHRPITTAMRRAVSFKWNRPWGANGRGGNSFRLAAVGACGSCSTLLPTMFRTSIRHLWRRLHRRSHRARSWFRFRQWPQDYDCFFNQRHQPEVDTKNPDVREYLIEAAVHALQARCDGFRLDYAHGLSHGFWSRFRAATRAAAPDCASFGEITQTPAVMRSYAGRMDGCLDFVLCLLLREFVPHAAGYR